MAVAEAPVFLAYRQRLANLECLRPLPLVLSIQEQQEEAQEAPRLASYYSTGSTVVASLVGRFHILDRSTHSLLSPSSVDSRLKLIEESRRRSDGTDQMERANDDDYGVNSYARSDDVMSMADSTSSRRDTLGSIAEFPKDQLSVSSSAMFGDDNSFTNPSLFSSLLTTREDAASSTHMIPLLGDPDLSIYLEAMNFIPSLEVAATGEEKFQALNRLPSRAALLLPFLTACYTRHGGAALLAVESLFKLLSETKFFDDDADISDDSGNESSTRLTLLDLAIQTVCDVATTGAEETTFSSCVEFVEHAIRATHGQLNTRTIGYVVRFYLFVFYFEASIPTRSLERWPRPSWNPTRNDSPKPNDDEDFSMLLDPREQSKSTYLPGGAPQAAALAFKELISLSIVRLGKVSVADLTVRYSASTRESALAEGTSMLSDPYGSFLDSILNSIVDDAVDHVERANYSQLALHQVLRSGGSELFWHDMVNTCGKGLFGKDDKLGEADKDIFIMVFAVLANLVKVSSGKLRSAFHTKEFLPRDIACKLLSLELLLHFLEFWSDDQEAVNVVTGETKVAESIQSMETLAFTIRRTVTPCLMWNTRASLENLQVF
jgi:hypothetical protein